MWYYFISTEKETGIEEGIGKHGRVIEMVVGGAGICTLVCRKM